ncbi:TnsD family Tn7-like transposition protein [Fictibacillus norfolkensis]|uniref:TnsD family transposase n=1 Tax=Fictibacillus norfolkensis TaxID=2762233 RepID=A0ABR8SR20_9BACL|nr:TnsD family Tn7-like transposition protein [Fictibacillus norfolkensis]MBD7965949.1 TnsD family transposase [Fictibacillus norfolkensis]
MIFFPNLYKDELLFSALARYFKYSGDENKKDFMLEIFNSSSTCASTIFPTNLKNLCEKLPSPNAYSTDYIINNHTLLPYYSPFLANDRASKLRETMKNEDGKNIFMKSGRTASTVKNEKKLKYCLSCVDEEKQTKGECYWHRSHQIEGVKVCPIHKTWLVESLIPFTERKHKHEFISLEDSIREADLSSIDINLKTEFKHFLYVAEQTEHLLNRSFKPLGLENLKNFYTSKLNKRQLVTLGGRIRWEKLIPKFNAYYGKQLLETLDSYIYPNKSDTWIHKLLRKPRVSCHPLRHILFLGFLGETIASMVIQIDTKSYKPFGDGPWICLNKAADHFHQPIVTSCVITRDYKSGHPIGTFSCSCGFVFSRRGPDKTFNDQYKIGRKKEFGIVWEDKLVELALKGLSLRKMADLLGVDPMTIKKKLTIKVEHKQSNNSFEKEKEEKKQNYRNQWIKMMIINEEETIKDIRLQNQKVYMWLYRNDKEWLKINSPTIQKGNRNNSVLKVNWKKRDADMVARVESIVSNILKEKKPLIKVTKNEIGRRLGILSSLYKNCYNLPMTLKVVNQSLETTEQFQERRIRNVVREMRKTNPSIKEWQVIRATGLKKKNAVKLKRVIIREIYGMN